MSGGIYRSEVLNYYRVIMTKESDWLILNEIGQTSLVHFDTQHCKEKNAFYLKEFKRIELIEQNLLKIESKLEEHPEFQLTSPSSTEIMENAANSENLNSKKSVYQLEQLLQDKLDQIQKNENFLEYQQQQKEYHEDQIEIIKLMQKTLTQKEQEQNNSDDEYDEQSRFIDRSMESGKFQLDCVCGIIPNQSMIQFERLVFRLTKTQSVLISEEIESGSQGRTVFLIHFIGGGHNIIKQKLFRACETFSSKNYQHLCEINPEDYGKKLENIQKELKEFDQPKLSTIQDLKLQISQFTNLVPNYEFSQYYLYNYIIQKNKRIYSALASSIQQGNQIVFFCYLPQYNEIEVMKCLQECSNKEERAAAQLQSLDLPSTHSMPSKFKDLPWLASTMEIVHTYGVPRYQELTPTVWTFITFPFFVGIMFGDIAHGAIVVALALFIYHQGNSKSNPLSQLWNYRLLILMIGISAVFCGLMYNEFLGLNAGWFGSCYNAEDGTKIKGCELAFGLDPIWALSENHIAFVNSLKMKLAIIFGVVQISLGIILKGFNDFFFSQWVTFFCDFLPQLIFFLMLFGFMVLVIFIKWMTAFPDPSKSYSILTIFISTPLDKLLIVIALVCVPILFFVHPSLLIFQKNYSKKQISSNDESDQIEDNEDSSLLSKSNSSLEKKDSKKEEKNDEIVTHTTISSIEFLLGTISNTASYLRLWALSLAHSQLSEVFFRQLLAGPIKDGNIFLICFGFFVFTNVTFGILICIDLLECFLHSLRLHWVEFQTKFFYGDGVAFEPLTFKNITADKN